VYVRIQWVRHGLTSCEWLLCSLFEDRARIFPRFRASPSQTQTSQAVVICAKVSMSRKLRSARPEWVPDAQALVCPSCKQSFTFTRRKVVDTLISWGSEILIVCKPNSTTADIVVMRFVRNARPRPHVFHRTLITRVCNAFVTVVSRSCRTMRASLVRFLIAHVFVVGLTDHQTIIRARKPYAAICVAQHAAIRARCTSH
jgi:hypothetical protein